MKPIDPCGFEQKFRADLDPWDYTTSPFEAYKRGVLLHACGSQTYGRGLELACAIGETTRYLARRCLQLLAVDSSETALKEARRRTTGNRRVTLRQALLPAQTPRGPFDLIVASEIAYYLPATALSELLRRLDDALEPGGRIVFLHHMRQFDDASQPPALAQAKIYRAFRQSMRLVFHERHARFDVVAFRKPRGPCKRQTKRRHQSP
jgi:cyclopropane fatty-acyl-phospholipid synthase-like methyltransferase